MFPKLLRFAILLLPAMSFAEPDMACMAYCTKRIMSWQYCQQACTVQPQQRGFTGLLGGMYESQRLEQEKQLRQLEIQQQQLELQRKRLELQQMQQEMQQQ